MNWEFFKIAHSRPLFLYFRLFYGNEQLVATILLKLGFEPRISDVKGYNSTTDPQSLPYVNRLTPYSLDMLKLYDLGQLDTQ